MPVANPRIGRRRKAFVLGGDVPNPINPPSGCRFHPRCPRAQAVCAENDPPLEPLGRHEAACFFPLEKWPLTDAEMRRADGKHEPATAAAPVAAASLDAGAVP